MISQTPVAPDLFARRIQDTAAETPLRPVRILAAGCGDPAMPGVDLRMVEHHVTGIDEDTPDLRAASEARGDLDALQLGDLRTAALPPRAFDVVYSTYLLERTPHPELVLDRCVSALRPGGLLLLRLRDRDSALGHYERVTAGPRRIARAGPAAGAPPRPLPAVYGRLAGLRGIRWYCLMRGLSIAEKYAIRTHALSGRPALVCRLLHAATRGRLSADHDQLVFVIRKPENRAARLL